MNLESIFGRSENTEARVPQVQVDGDRLRIPTPPLEPAAQENPPDARQNTRELQFPKTKWY